MLGNLVEKMKEWPVYSDKLDEPISLTRAGKIATWRDMIAERASDDILAAFRSVMGETMARTTNNVTPVEELDTPSLKKLALEVVKNSDPRKGIAFGIRSYDRDLVVDLIEGDTPLGLQLIELIRVHSDFMQRVIDAGKIVPRPEPTPELKLPEFEF